jgi:hypothetical protein
VNEESDKENFEDIKNLTFNNFEDNNYNNELSKKEKNRNETIENIKNIVKKTIEVNSLKSENIFQHLQPDKFSYGRNMYPHVFKELETTIKYKTKKDF